MERQQAAPIVLAPRPSSRHSLTVAIKRLALEHGLSISAVTTADAFSEVAQRLAAHITAGHIEGLAWFTPERAQFSTDPRNLHPGALSILSVGIAYRGPAPDVPADNVPRGRIARYAWGADYHKVLKQRMTSLLAAIEAFVGHRVEARLLVDTARIVDRAVAERSGLGWIGKNACLIVPRMGSWVLLGELLLDLDLEPDAPLGRDCGRCTICLDRCPTNAIIAPYTIHTPRCISFQTIEQRGSIPRELRRAMGNWVFGCDVCQDVCPYTAAVRVEADAVFHPATLGNAFPDLRWLLTMSEAEFRAVYQGTPVTRTKRRGLARNAAIALGNTGTRDATRILITALREHDEPLVRGHAAWALGGLGGSAARLALERHRGIEPDDSVMEEIEFALNGGAVNPP